MGTERWFVLVSVLAAFDHGAFGYGFPLLAKPLLVLDLDMRTYRGMLRGDLCG